MSKHVSKTEQAKALFENNKPIKALAIFSTFKIGITKDQQEVLKRAYEMNNGSGSKVYEQMGFDAQSELRKAIDIIQLLYYTEALPIDDAQRELLFEAWAYCDEEDKSTEFMFTYMADVAGVDYDVAVDFVIQTTEEERDEWYKNREL